MWSKAQPSDEVQIGKYRMTYHTFGPQGGSCVSVSAATASKLVSARRPSFVRVSDARQAKLQSSRSFEVSS